MKHPASPLLPEASHPGHDHLQQPVFSLCVSLCSSIATLMFMGILPQYKPQAGKRSFTQHNVWDTGMNQHLSACKLVFVLEDLSSFTKLSQMDLC